MKAGSAGKVFWIERVKGEGEIKIRLRVRVRAGKRMFESYKNLLESQLKEIPLARNFKREPNLPPSRRKRPFRVGEGKPGPKMCAKK